MDFSGILSQKLTGTQDELAVLAKIGDDKLRLPKRESLTKLVDTTAFNLLKKLVNETPVETRSSQGATKLNHDLVSKGLQKIAAVIGETASSSEKEFDLPKSLYEQTEKAVQEFITSIEDRVLLGELQKIKQELKGSLDEMKRASQEQNANDGSIISQTLAINTRMSSIKADILSRAVIGGEFKITEELDRGKAKLVLKTTDPTKVVYQPLIRAKEAELREEVSTSKKIKAILFDKAIVNVLSLSNYNDERAPVIAELLHRKYPSIKDLVEALEKHPLGVSNHIEKQLAGTGDSTLAKRRAKEIQEFLTTPSNLAILKGHQEDLSHLAVNMKELQNMPTYSVETAIAYTNGEKFIQERPIKFSNLLLVCLHSARGAAILHDAGYVQGDTKPENMLVFEKMEGNKKSYLVQNSDWGKAQQMGEDENRLYTGNPRFAPPERRLSKKGEVYSQALITIRALEEAILDKKQNGMVMNPAATKTSSIPLDKRRGIEKFLSMSGNSTQMEISGIFGSIRVYGGSLLKTNNTPDSAKLKAAERDIHDYIATLIGELRNLPSQDRAPLDDAKLSTLENLLKRMTSSNPTERPTMRDAVNSLEVLLG